MSAVNVTINGRSYTIVCDDGQEDHLRRLSESLDRRVGELSASLGQIGDSRLLVLAGLSALDELSDAYANLDAAKAEARHADKAQAAALAQARAEGLDRASAQIEAMAARLEAAAGGDG